MSDKLTKKFNTLRGLSKSSSKSEETTNGTSNSVPPKQSVTSSSFFENPTTNVNRSQTMRPGRNTINHGMEGSMQDREPLPRSLSATQIRKQFEKPLPPPPVPASSSMPNSPSVLDQAEATFQLLRDNTPISSPAKPPPPLPPKRTTVTSNLELRQKYATMRPTSTLSASTDSLSTKDENRQSVLVKSLPPPPQKPPSFPKPNFESQSKPINQESGIEPSEKSLPMPPKEVQASQRTSISPTTSPRESTVVASATDPSQKSTPPLPAKSTSMVRSTSNQSLNSLAAPNSPQTIPKPPPRSASQLGGQPPAYATLRNVNSARSHHRWASVDIKTTPTTPTPRPLPPPPPRTQSTSSIIPQSVTTTPSPPPPEDEQTILERKEKKRTAVLNELIATEITYIESLKKSIEFYQNPFREQLASDPTKFVVDGRPLTSQEVSIIFSNTAMICGFNQQLLEELQARQKTWNPSTLIGDIFLRLTPFLKLYTEYSNNYDKAMDFLKKSAKQSEAFKALFEGLRYQKDGQLIPPIDSLLIAPIQRIPRYNLLLGEMIKSTSQDHPDYQNLNAALTLMQEVANHINNSMKTSENFQKLVAIEEQLVNLPANWEVVIPSRIVLKDGVLTELKHEGKKKKNLRLILFNDNLLLCRPQLLTNKLKFVFTAPILQLFTLDVPDTPAVVFCFKIQHPSRTFTVYANSSVDKQNWVQHISDARDKQMEIEGAKMVFKLLKKEEERRVLLKMKSMSTGNLNVVQSQPAMSVRAQSEIERIMMESQKMQRVKQAEEEMLKKKKEQEEEEARRKKLERKMKKARKEKTETDPDGKEKKKKKKKKKSKDKEGAEKKERKHRKKKREIKPQTDEQATLPNDNKPQREPSSEQEEKVASEESSEDESSQSEAEAVSTGNF